jgi:hypothetical protein
MWDHFVGMVGIREEPNRGFGGKGREGGREVREG